MTQEKLLREVDTIRTRNEHPNIIPFFAGFIAGREKPWELNSKAKCLHMLFEHADAGNMEKWLQLEVAPAPLADVAERRKHIISCISDLVSAVTFIHKEIKGFVAYHHDLKPANIVLFKGPPGIWKICDFGLANIKHHEEESGTEYVSGTYDYQPPEYFTNDSGRKHGRPFDVYSLGCIVLELVTIAILGWSEAGLPEFHRLRGENINHACTKLRKPDPDYSFHNSPNTVKDWIHRLREQADDETLRSMLDLVSEMLVPKAQRIFVWEVDMDIYEMRGSRTIEQLRAYLRDVVQSSDKSLNGLDNEHNPLKRAIQNKKAWQKDILERYKWSVKKPELSYDLRIKRRETEGVPRTTLKACPHSSEFERNRLFGRHDLDTKISEGLKFSNCVGLYGMSGIG